jgi:hypothetical protein
MLEEFDSWWIRNSNLCFSDAVMMTSMPVTPKTPHGSVVSLPDVSEQRQWWQLEEVNNSYIKCKDNICWFYI